MPYVTTCLPKENTQATIPAPINLPNPRILKILSKQYESTPSTPPKKPKPNPKKHRAKPKKLNQTWVESLSKGVIGTPPKH